MTPATARWTLLLLLTSSTAWAQARYDDHPGEERVKIMFGGFRTQDLSSELRVDSQRYGIGTVLSLEDQLNLERAVTVARLDGFYRFNRAHRLEWTFFSQNRGGVKAVFDDDVSIGDVVIPATYSIDTVLNIRFEKVSYAWSFINTRPYEFFVGAGVNFRHVSMTIDGTGTVADDEDVRTFASGKSVPLPTLTAGMRYNITDRLKLNFRLESFFLKLGEDSGRWNDSYLTLEYGLSRHFGFGGGLNASTLNIRAKLDEDLTAGLDSSHVGVLLYLSAVF